MKKSIVIILLLSLSVTFANAQQVYNSSGKKGYKREHKKKGYDPDRLIIGGGLNAFFDNGYLELGISPIVGYRLNKFLSAGVGIGYQYFRAPAYNVLSNDISYKNATVINPNVWTRCTIYRNLYAAGIFEYNLISTKTPPGVEPNVTGSSTQKDNYGVPCALVGLGLRQPIGGRVAFFGELMYDVIQNQRSPYFGQTVIRLGIAAGF
jgi:hypothetical protein